MWFQILHEMIVSVIQFAVQRKVKTGFNWTVSKLAHAAALTITAFLSSSWNSVVKRRTDDRDRIVNEIAGKDNHEYQ
jgi:hypothetical protein